MCYKGRQCQLSTSLSCVAILPCLLSLSRRNSVWANSALVVSLQPDDWAHLVPEHGALAGMALQVRPQKQGAGSAF